jgi:DeoR/GlpR family transcriptional regulator of sugar metabolism
MSKEILEFLKKNGEKLDSEIAEAMGISLTSARTQLAELAAKGEIMACHSTRFDSKGKKIEGIKCRLAGFIPPAAPGRKSKSQLKLS